VLRKEVPEVLKDSFLLRLLNLLSNEEGTIRYSTIGVVLRYVLRVNLFGTYSGEISLD